MSRETVTALFAVLRPPDAMSDSHPEQHSYNWRVFWALIIIVVLVVGHLAISYGLIPRLHRGFAGADEVRELRLLNLQEAILQTNERWCRSSGDARGLYYRALLDLRSKYFELQKHDVPLPRCDEL